MAVAAAAVRGATPKGPAGQEAASAEDAAMPVGVTHVLKAESPPRSSPATDALPGTDLPCRARTRAESQVRKAAR